MNNSNNFRRIFKRLTLIAVFWTFCLIVLGAYVRLSDAGLGCPDWPGCYGHIGVPDSPDELARAQQLHPDSPVESAKAWKEMIHRYVAGGLGFLILAIVFLAITKQRYIGQSPVLATSLIGVLLLQAALGMWTVTLLLKPAIVTAHLLGGLTTLGLLYWLALRQMSFPSGGRDAGNLRTASLVGLILVLIQIALGGWVSTNYAALACTDFPTCQGSFWPAMEFGDAFHIFRELGMKPNGANLTMENVTAIHYLHRLMAGCVLVYGIWLAFRLVSTGFFRVLGYLLLGALALQIAMGIGNVVLQLPLLLAVAHNAGAAFLLIVMLTINFRVRV